VTPPRASEPQPATYDERVYRKGSPPHRIRNALILIAILLVGSYLAVAKSLPFGDDYEVKAVFENAANIRADSPVRIAGVNVGKVTGVRSVGDAAEVTFTVSEDGRPVREDAQVEIRPRIFLEGNFFLDVKPGSPSAEELPDDGTIPITQTATAVQLDEVLTTLQAPDRDNLSKLLRGYGTALNGKPSAADDRGQDPDIQGETGAEAINDSFRYGGDAGRDSAIVNEALLGTEPGDLSGLIAGSTRVFNALASREGQLRDLITNFNTTVGAFAAESDDLAESVRLLAPTLERAEPALRNTNETFPYLRAFARDIEPGIRELPATIAVSGPWLTQTHALLAPDELGFIADELRRGAPGAAAAAAAGAGAFSQVELLSRCVGQVLVPTGDVVLDDSGAGYDFGTGVPNHKEFGYAVSGFAGESQNFDGNGPYLRLQAGGGDVRVRGAQPGGGARNDFLFGDLPDAPIGTRPVLGPKPPYRTDIPCQINAIPDLNGPAAAEGPPSPAQFP
jgi:phospholipid/cholesterol/gamma-HCH transport system substrate-binding protein